MQKDIRTHSKGQKNKTSFNQNLQKDNSHEYRKKDDFSIPENVQKMRKKWARNQGEGERPS